uniref:FYN binding protein 1 n=1 Tax=Capra hircus TaxID=9925 RepID=A0A8C2PL81_CAPHI
MAKFNTGGNPTEEVSINSRPFKVPGQNSPSGIQAKKNLFNNQGNASPPAGLSNSPKFGSPKPPLGVKPSPEEKPDKEPKPPFLKPTGVSPRFGPQANSATRDSEVKAGFLKPVGPKPINLPKEDAKPAFPWPPGTKPLLPSVNQDHDLKPGPKPGSMPPALENEPKQVLSKLAGAKGKFLSKPPMNTEDLQEDESPTKTVAPQRGPLAPLAAKAKSGPLKPAREEPENKEHGGETSVSPFPGVVLKPAANRGAPGGLPRNTEEKREDRKMDAAKNIFLSKITQEELASGAPPGRFSKTPSKLTSTGPWSQSQDKEKGDKNSATPRQKPLPSLLTLGPPPPKPSRPPHVDLSKFRKATSGNSTNKGPMTFSTTALPPPPPSHPSSQPPLPASHPTQLPAPSLPPRNIKPPLDLKDTSKEKEKKREKEEKKRLDFKQGENIEIIRITDNPEGKWLGRTARGSYGYIKTTAVEIDYDSLKRKKGCLSTLPSRPFEDDQEVYDDVADICDQITKLTDFFPPNSHEGMFPPPPDDDIYDGIEEEDAADGSTLQVEEKSNTWSWGILKMLKGKDDKKKSIREKPKDSESDNDEGSSFPSPPKQVDMGDEVYDDVDASDFPPPPIEISQGVKPKAEEKDPKKLKKQEKEEKDFRKKFKYDGEIRVLYSTKVAPSLSSKKWGNRDLQIKPGESLEVIQNTDDTKVLCRNEEGKCKSLLTLQKYDAPAFNS